MCDEWDKLTFSKKGGSVAGWKIVVWSISVVLSGAISAYAATTLTGATDDPGTLIQWHKVTLIFDGPNLSESVAAFAI